MYLWCFDCLIFGRWIIANISEDLQWILGSLAVFQLSSFVNYSAHEPNFLFFHPWVNHKSQFNRQLHLLYLRILTKVIPSMLSLDGVHRWCEKVATVRLDWELMNHWSDSSQLGATDPAHTPLSKKLVAGATSGWLWSRE